MPICHTWSMTESLVKPNVLGGLRGAPEVVDEGGGAAAPREVADVQSEVHVSHHTSVRWTLRRASAPAAGVGPRSQPSVGVTWAPETGGCADHGKTIHRSVSRHT